MAEDVNTFREWLKVNAVWPALHRNGLHGFERLGVPHHHRAAAAKTVTGHRVNRHAARPGIGDGADGFQRVQIKDQNLVPARDVKLAVGVVRIDIIGATGAQGLGGIDNRVRFRVLGKSRRAEGGQAAQGQQAGESS